jgi:hypothetical protein
MAQKGDFVLFSPHKLLGLMGGKNAILFICSFVGVNAVFEMCASTFLTGAVGLALIKAKVIPVYQKAESAA